MATNLAIDDKLIDEARRIGNYKTKREAVTAALDEFIRRRKQLEILDHFRHYRFRSGIRLQKNAAARPD